MARIISFRTSKNKFSDAEIIQGLLTNKREIINHIYKEFFPKANALLSRMGAREEEIKDVFQEGMVALWKNIHKETYKLQSSTKLSSYLVEICKRRWLEKVRKKTNQSNFPIEPIELSSREPNALEQWLKREELEKFQQLFQQLNQRCQNLLQRFYYEKENVRQMAASLSLTEATVRNEKYRCMQKLKTIFSVQKT